MADKNAVWQGLDEGFVPTDEVGFVYLITDNTTGARYIGKKSFWSVSKGVTKESNWRKYQSSSDTVKKWTDVTKEVLCLCYSKFELSYREMEYIIKSDAVLRDNFLNYAIGREMIGRCPQYMKIR